MPAKPGEFDLIRRYFAPLAGPEGLSLADDCAHITPPMGETLILSKDMMVEGVHFPHAAPSKLVGARALGAALSDLCASAAKPLGYFLGLALPPDTHPFDISAFAAGLGAAQADLGIQLLGGDTVKCDCLTLSITVVGASPKPVKRAGAQAGDDIYVTGALGGAAAALPLILGQKKGLNDRLSARYWAPKPRQSLVPLLQHVATAAIDISDGLAADCLHLCDASSVGVRLKATSLPIEQGASLKQALSGGDDYEILFTAPPSARGTIKTEGQKLDYGISRIGQIVNADERVLLDGKDTIDLADFPGFDHTRP